MVSLTSRPDRFRANETDACRHCRLIGTSLCCLVAGSAAMDARAEADRREPIAAAPVAAASAPVGAGSAEPIAAATVLDDVTVVSTTASGYGTDPVHAPASVSVVDQRALADHAYRDITQALQDVPGLFVDDGPTSKGGTGEISLRGLDPKYTLILVDGIPQNSTQAFYNGYGAGTEFGWLPPISEIAQIEVIRGPMSTLYGSDALGGVINVVTKPVADVWSGTLSVDAIVQENSASGNRQQTDFRLSGPIVTDRLSLTLYGEVQRREEDAIENGYPGYDARNLTGEIDWAPNTANRFTLEAQGGEQDTRATADLTGANRALDTGFQRQTLRHRYEWTDRIVTRSYVQRTELDQDDASYTSTYERWTANTATVLPIASHLVTGGVEYRLQRTKNPDRGLGVSNLSRWDTAVFIEDEWAITRDLALTAGLRNVYDENYANKLVPRIYGVYDLTDQLVLKGGVSAGYRTPDLKEGDSGWIEGGGGPGCPGCRTIGNSDLEPESSVTYEAGLYWAGDTTLSASTTYYHTDFRDKIATEITCDTRETAARCDFANQSHTAIYRYLNIDKARIDGIETTLSVNITDRLSTSATYTLTDSEQQTGSGAGLPLDNQPRHRATVDVDWQATDATRFWGAARYKGQTRQTATRRGLSETYPSYTLVDAGASHALTPTLTVYAGVYNLFDKTIRYEDYNRVLDGRRYNLGVRLSFGGTRRAGATGL